MAMVVPGMTQELGRDLLTRRVHLAEINRRIFGADTDLDIIAGALSSAERGYMVDITDMENEQLIYDLHLASMPGKRFGTLSAADWSVTPPSGVAPSDRQFATEIASCVQDIFRKLQINRSIMDIAWALYHARAASEVHWAAGAWGYKFAPYSIEWIHPRRLCFGAFRELRVVDTNHQTMTFSSEYGIPVEETPGKFLYWKPRRFSEYAEREGLGPKSAYWSFFKRFNQRQRMKLTELWGLPWRIVEVDKDAPANPESLIQAKQDAEDLGGETTAVFDRGIKLNVEWPGENSGKLMEMSHDQINAEVSKLWLGNTGTSEQGSGASGSGTRANSIIGKGEQDILFQLDGTEESEVFQNLAMVIVLMNYGPGALHLVPRFQIQTQPQRDRDKEVDRLIKVISIGVPVALADVREVTGYRAPLEDEVYLIGKSAGVDEAGKPMPPVITIVDPAKTAPGLSPGSPPNSTEPAASEPLVPKQDPPATETKNPAKPPAAKAPKDPADPNTSQEDGGADKQKGALEDAIQRATETDYDLQVSAGSSRTSGYELGQPRSMQPATAVHGSPENVIDRGVTEAQRETTKWAHALSGAGVGDSAIQIRGKLARAAATLDLEKFSRAMEKRLVYGLMLGALDADWESENDRIVKPPAFDIGLERDGEAFELAEIGPGGGVVDFVNKPFAEALRIFNQRAVVPRKLFDRLSAAAKQRAFTVAGLTRQGMLETAHSELSSALERGDDLRGFRDALAERFESAGWTKLNPSHVETIFRTNVMGAYSDGRESQMTQPHVLEARPFWQVVGVSDSRTRANHKAALGKVLRADDPFWARAKPPFGFNCRCRRVSRSPDDVERLGLEVVSGASLSGLPDKGWNGSGSLL